MKINSKSLSLYAVTDSKWTGKLSLEDQVKLAIEGGITFLQLREKELEHEKFLKEALCIKQLANKANIPFVINDDVNLALECNADGVHVGQSDMKANDVRKLIGPDKILGVSAHTVEEAMLAEKQGADYLGVGAVFATSTKLDADSVSYEQLSNICKAVSIPVVAIGGITESNISELKGSGVKGVAVISAIFAQDDILKATKTLKKLSEESF